MREMSKCCLFRDILARRCGRTCIGGVNCRGVDVMAVVTALWQVVLLGVIISWGVMVVDGRALESKASPCSPPLFVFGASYLDVGENAAATPFREASEREPYGLDYFDGKPSGRYSNGRLIIDHISQGLGQELLSPYLRNMGTRFGHGVSFASSGSTARNASVVGSCSWSAFSLSTQINQFRVFHKQTLAMYESNIGTAPGRLPAPEDFSRGVYIIESGNNDYEFKLDVVQVDEALISSVLDHIEHAIRTLYLDGARTIVVMDLFPRGCYAGQLSKVTGPDEVSEDGCRIETMKVVERHNARLREMVPNLNAELPGATLIIFSLYDMFLSAIRNPSKFGLKYVHKACCGYGGGDYNFNSEVECGVDGIVDGQLRKATVCENRSEYLMWDYMHPTEAFSFHVAQAFLNGTHMQPPFYIKEMCWPHLSNSL